MISCSSAEDFSFKAFAFFKLFAKYLPEKKTKVCFNKRLAKEDMKTVKKTAMSRQFSKIPNKYSSPVSKCTRFLQLCMHINAKHGRNMVIYC